MKLVNSIIGIFCVLTLSSCGLIDTMSRMEDYSKSLDEKMDKTNQGIEKTNGGMDKTIEGINRTNNGMDKTNEAIHKQVLTVALQQMLEKQNTEFLNPPLSILPAAHIFAEEATATEILELIYVYYMDVQIGYDESALENGGVPTEDEMRIHTRKVRWAVIGALAAQASDEKFEEIQKAQVENPGRYNKAARVFAVARYDMMKTALLKPILGDQYARNLGGLKKAAGYYQSLKKVADLPYFIASTDAPAFFVTLPKIIVQETEVVPDPAKPDVKVKTKEYLSMDVKVESSKPVSETLKPEIVRLAQQCKSVFGKTEGDEAKKLIEQFN